MTGYLDENRQLVQLESYGREFVANRLGTSTISTGSLFNYMSCDLRLPYGARRFGMRPVGVEFKMTFLGCAVKMSAGTDFTGRPATIVTLALPPNANNTAVSIQANQLAFLQQIAEEDAAAANAHVQWGVPPHANDTPTVVVSLRDRGSYGVEGRPALIGERFGVGDDIVFTGSLARLDNDDENATKMTYLFTGTMDRVLRSDQLRVLTPSS
ncbi:hypothetical protein C8R43DRAFT_1129287 [Mycena crocata]|nr:hypothetical protein C8R43DRAFT_1129287 [Mycena crocata]